MRFLSLSKVGFLAVLVLSSACAVGCSSSADDAAPNDAPAAQTAAAPQPTKTAWKLGEFPAAYEGQLGASSWIAFAGLTTDGAGAEHAGILAYGINSEGDISAVVFHDLSNNQFAVWENKSRTSGCTQGDDSGCVSVDDDLRDVYFREYKNVVSLATASGNSQGPQGQSLHPLDVDRASACVLGALMTVTAALGGLLTVAAVASGAGVTVSAAATFVAMVGIPVAITGASLSDVGAGVAAMATETGKNLEICAAGR